MLFPPELYLHRLPRWGPGFAVFGLVFLASTFQCVAQLPESAEDGQRVSGQRLATDRKATQVLRSFKKQLASGNISRALDDLDILRALDPHVLVASNYPGVFVPLFRAVFDATYEIPSDQREVISQTQSTSAQLELAAILAESQPEEIPALVLRSAGTKTAVDAHFVAARLHLLRGGVSAARSWLQPLAHGHMPKELQQTTASILKTLRSSEAGVGGEAVEAAADNLPALPKYLAWQARSSMAPKLQNQIDTFLKAAHADTTAPQTVWSSCVESDVAYRRSLKGLKAIDLETGMTKWEYPIGAGVDSMILADRANSSLFASRTRSSVGASNFANLEKSPLVNAFCRNNSLGRIAADATQLYVVSPDDFGPSGISSPRVMVPSRGVSARRASSTLIAVDKATGRRVWSMGQSTLEESLGASPDGCWIAGPPASHGRCLYSVFEWDGVMRLGCVSSSTGELEWSTNLSYPEQTIDKDGFRKFWAATPICKDGLIWCPTTTGWLVCIDEITRSTVYASSVQPDLPDPGRTTIGRNQPVVFTPFASLKERWSEPKLIPSGENIAVICNEAREIFVVDAVTGEQQKKIRVDAGEFCVHCDESQIVLAGPSTIRCVQTVTGKQLWQNEFDSFDIYPIGKAARQGNHILIPMSDGSATLMNLVSGDIEDVSDAVIPIESWGYLTSVGGEGGDLLYVAPDRISRLSAEEPAESPGDPLQIASGLLASGKWEQALDAASRVSKSNAGRREAESIIFASRLQLAASNPDKYLEQLTSSPLTIEQSLQVQVFQAAIAFNNGDYESAATRITELLIQEPAMAELDVPPIAMLWKEGDTTEAEPALLVRPTLLAWTSARLSEIAELSPESFDSEGLQQVTDDVILSLNHPIALPILHQRMKDADSEELFYQLLQQAVSIQLRQPERRVATEVEIAETRYGKDSASAAELTEEMKLILAVSYHESAPEFQACVDWLQPALSERSADLNSALSGKFSQWNATSFRPVPVSRSQTITSRVASVDVAEKEDAFLGEFSWQIVQGDAGRLVATRLVDPKQRWSIAGNFQGFSNYSMHSDVIHRAGSVALLKTTNGLTAVSALDQRILWTRTPEGRKRTSLALTTRNFTKYAAGVNSLPSSSGYSAFQIVGSGHRWVCLRSAESIEVLDLYSGRVMWSASIGRPFNRVVATDDFVVVGSTYLSAAARTEVLCFDCRTGQSVELANVLDVSKNTIRNVGPVAVMWRTGNDSKPNSIEWVNLATGATEQTVDLTDMQSFHFLDDRTLIGVSENQTFSTVDLVTGETSVYSFRTDESNAERSLPADSSSKTPENGPPDSKLWDHARIQVTSDPLNYYVSNRLGNKAVLFRQSFGRSSLRFEGDLRVVDRATKELRWVYRGKPAFVATTEQAELPFLAMWDDSNQFMRMPGNGKKNLLYAYDKLTGRELFRQHVPSRYGWRFINLEAPKTDVVDVTVYGTRIRMIGEAPE